MLAGAGDPHASGSLREVKIPERSVTRAQRVVYGPPGMPIQPPTSNTPGDRSSLRALAVALVLLVAVSAGPAAASSTSDPVRATGSETVDLARVVARSGGGYGWLYELEAVLDAATTAIAQAAGGEDASVARAGGSVPQGRESTRRFKMNLFRKGDFVSQKTTYWCIPASTQMMMNMMDSGRPDRSRALQARLYRIGDRLEEDGTFSPDPEPDRWRGMGISEWVGLLNRYDYGPYELAGARSFQKALKKAARMMRKTGKPVGLVVWRGAHAWVMSGFAATADPALTNDFTVTKVWVQDPWYPRVSSIWGRSRGPDAKVSPRVLRQDFKRYGRPGRRNPERDGRFMLVLPRPDRAAASAA